MCQSPSRRGTHFYLCTHAHIDHCGGCVNPLHVGKLISTWSRRNGKDTSLVSIPFTSGNSFLQKENVKGILTKKSVNPLHVGELISTLHYYLIAWSPLCVNPLHVGELISTKQTRPSHGCIKCVNPLHVGELISTYQSSLQGSKGWTVSIPFTSGNSFLQGPWRSRAARRRVSIPFTSGNSFLLYSFSGAAILCVWCQSPSRRGTHFYITFFYFF